MIRLFIENSELELTKDVQVAITKQFEDLSNPTDIINDWSKTVSIPFTTNNNRIFGNIFSPDKAIVNGGTVGVYFNPLLKMNFRLEWDSNIVMSGYAKLNEVKQVNGKGTYEITLFGELGKVFQEMQKITFDMSTDEDDYLIDGEEYVSEYINKDLVYNSWINGAQTYSELKRVSEGGYTVTDIIGFAPNNSFSEEFKYDTFQSDTYSSATFAEALGTGFTEDTGIEPDTVIPDGMLPREIGEYRSYLQLPFIYWNKLFQIFQQKAESVTGYDFELDGDWFNTSNPYWFNLVYMLKPFDSKLEETVTNYYKITLQDAPGWGNVLSAYTTPKITNVVFTDKNEVKPVVNGNNIQLSNDYTVFFNTTYTISLDISNYNNLRINPNNGLEYSFRVLDTNNNVLDEYKYLMVDNDYSGNTDGYVEVLRFGRQGSGAFVAYPKLNIMINKGEFGNIAKLDFKAVWLNGNAPFYDNNNNPFTPSPTLYTGYVNLYVYNIPTNNPILCNVISNRKRSNNHFILNDLWNNEYNLFNEILKYCKMYRIAISVDEFNKKVMFTSYPNYFSDYTVSDWTEKVDKSKDFTITPVTFDKKYILFNYKDSDTQLGSVYKEKYGVNYGEYRLITDYNFNSDTTELFDNVTPSITNTDNVLSWNNLYDKHRVIYSFPSEFYVYNKDDDNKQVDIFGAYYFHNGLNEFSTETALNLRDVIITDDTQFQQANNTYFYSQWQGDYNYVTTYPRLDIVRGDNLCVFNTPKENYTYLNNYVGKKSIYDNLWDTYINERYNVQNKKITCYVNIKPTDYTMFDWKKLVKVGNQLCIVNKIYDYDISDNGTTKVDLLTIQNISGYTTIPYTYDYILLTEHNLRIPYDAYKTITVKSTGNWEINADDWDEDLVAYPQSGTSGETMVIIGTTDEEHGGRITFNLLDNNDNVIVNDSVRVTVGGTNTISVTPWYNQITVDNDDEVTVTTNGGMWYILAEDNRGGVTVNLDKTSGGSTQIGISVPSTSNTGIVDYYLQNVHGDITSFRVHVVS